FSLFIISLAFRFSLSISLVIFFVCFIYRRDQENPLDLNNFPNEYSGDGKPVFEEGSASGSFRKKKSGGKESGRKVYDCRFCSLKFCKSQALGGHMNRHRQERKIEILNRARQLVFNKDNKLAVQGSLPLGFCQPIAPGSYHHAATADNMAAPDPTLLPLRSFPRYFPLAGSTTTHFSPPPVLPSRSMSSNCPPHHPGMNDYCMGHVLNHSLDYNCIGAPVRPAAGYVPGGSSSRVSGGSEVGLEGGGRDGSLHNQQHLDPSIVINRFQEGFQ
ncbi:zinc finger protein JAGGED-like, partial [Quillaja saponaria]